jgi:hypothetical protein
MSRETTGRGKAAVPEVASREMEIQDMAPIFSLGEQLFTSDRWPNLYRTWDEYEVLSLFASDRETCLAAELDAMVVGFARRAHREAPRAVGPGRRPVWSCPRMWMMIREQEDSDA